MNSEKIVYWVALGVFALGVSHEYRAGKFPAAHSAVTHAEMTMCRLASRVSETVALARFVVDPPATANHDVLVATNDFGSEQVEMLRVQALDQAGLVREQARMQAELLRAQAELRHAQIEQLSRVADYHFSQAADRRVTLICPKTGARIAVKVNPPDVEVNNNF